MFIIFLLVIATRQSTITLMNCPNSPNTSLINATTSYNVNFLQLLNPIYDLYLSDTMKQIFRSIIINQNQTQFNKYQIKESIPFLFLALIFIIIYVSLIISYYCANACPPCKSWRKSKKIKRMYFKSQIRWTAIFAGVSTIMIIASSSLVLISLTEIKDTYTNSKCSFYLTLDTAIYGDNNEWSGFNSLESVITNISANLNNTRNSIATHLNEINFKQIRFQILMQMSKNRDIYEKYKNCNLSSPDPQTSDQISSLFITNQLGPIQSNGTMTHNINSVLQQILKIVNAAYNINTSAQILLDSLDNIQTKLNKSLINLKQYNKDLLQYKIEMDHFLSKYVFILGGINHSILATVIGLFLAAAALSIFGVLGAHICDLYQCKNLTHVAWLIFGFFYLALLAFIYALLPLGALSHEACDYYSQIFKDQARFQDFRSYSVLSKLKQCLIEEGNALKIFEIDYEVFTISNLFNNVNHYISLAQKSSNNYINVTSSIVTLQKWIHKMENYRDGILSDSNILDRSNGNPDISLINLNYYTLMQIYPSQNCTHDRWVFNSINCTQNEKIYTPGIDSKDGLTLNIPNLCISFNSAINQTQQLRKKNWSQNDFISRYIQLADKCPNSYLSIIEYGKSLINYRDSKMLLFQAIIDDLKEILVLNQVQLQFLNNIQYQIKNFFNDIVDINLMFKNKGSTMNCSILGDQVKMIYNSYCINYMKVATQVCIFLILLSLMIIIGMFTNYFFGMRYDNIEVIVFRLNDLKLKQERNKQLDQPENLDSDIILTQ